jgi:elongation factor G
MAKYKVEDIRNIALVGHGASGKTTLADTMLFKAKAVDRRGSPDDGTSVSDFDEDAKKRHASIDANILHFEDKGKHVNLIDTPGFPDFIGQAIVGLTPVDNAVVVISAPAGIEVNTRRLYNEAKKMGLARILVINKMDADNIDFDMVLDAIEKTFGKSCVLFNIPVGSGAKFSGVVDVLHPPASKPADLLMDVEAARAKLMEAAVEVDDALMEKYLGEGTLTDEELNGLIPKAIANGNVIPIFCCSGKKDIGVTELMAGLEQYALSPAQGAERKITKSGGEATPIKATENGPAIGQVFKVISDKFVGTLAYIRVYSGKFHGELFNARSNKAARTGGLLEVQGKNTKPMAEAIAGDIFAVAKVEDLRLGDTVGDKSNPGQIAKPNFPTPMFGLAVEPKARGDEQKISGSLARIAEEDPTFKVDRDPQTKELVINGVSQLHLDIIQHRLKRRFELEVNTKEPKIPYRETIVAKGESNYRHKKQSGGRGQFGEVHLRVYPVPRTITSDEQARAEFMNKQHFPQIREDHSRYEAAHNFVFVDSIVGGTIPNQFIPAVYKGCVEMMERGVVAGYRMQDICAEVHFGKYHDVDSSEAAFKTAARNAFKLAIANARGVLLEPVVILEVTVPSKYVGAILSDLNTKRARIENQDSLPGDLAVITAKAPLAEVTRYAAQLSSITQGQGSYTMEFSHYDQVPGNVQQQIVAKAAKVEEEEEE